MSAPRVTGIPPQEIAAPRPVVIATVAGGTLALASGVLLAGALGFAPGDVAPDLSRVPASRAGLLRWGALTDLLGFYLLSVPVALHLGAELGDGDDPALRIATVAGVAYAVTGAIGAVVVASVAAPMIGVDSARADLVLDVVRRGVFIGLWQTLTTTCWGVWLVVVGRRLHARSRWLGGAAVAIGSAALAAAGGRFVALEPLVAVSTTVAIAAYPLWLLALGWWLARRGPS